MSKIALYSALQNDSVIGALACLTVEHHITIHLWRTCIGFNGHRRLRCVMVSRRGERDRSMADGCYRGTRSSVFGSRRKTTARAAVDWRWTTTVRVCRLLPCAGLAGHDDVPSVQTWSRSRARRGRRRRWKRKLKYRVTVTAWVPAAVLDIPVRARGLPRSGGTRGHGAAVARLASAGRRRRRLRLLHPYPPARPPGPAPPRATHAPLSHSHSRSSFHRVGPRSRNNTTWRVRGVCGYVNPSRRRTACAVTKREYVREEERLKNVENHVLLVAIKDESLTNISMAANLAWEMYSLRRRNMERGRKQKFRLNPFTHSSSLMCSRCWARV